jgi:hypothetical protein
MIENGKDKISIDFHSKKIKGHIENVNNQKLFVKYENHTYDKSYGDLFEPNPMETIRFQKLKYPLDLYIDFKTRYLHFNFLKDKPSIFECSGLVAHK